MALLVGDNGSGKTWMLEQVASAQRRPPFRVEHARLGDLCKHTTLIVADRLGQDLHHDRIAPLGDWLREQAERVPILAATVNPYAVDCFAYGEVWVLHERRAARLDQHPDVDAWRGKLQAGEFWVSVGEAWVAESPHAITLDALVELLRNQASPSTSMSSATPVV